MKFVILIVLFATTAAVSAALVEDEKGNQIQPVNLEAYLILDEAPIEARLKLYDKKDSVKEQLHNLYLIKSIAETAKKEGLLNNEYERQKLQQHIDKYYFTIKLKELREKNLPDFEPLAKAYYQVNKQKYKTQEQVNISHIMLMEKKHSELEMQGLIEEIQDRIKKGKNFLALAKEYSDDPSVEKNKGELGLIPQEKLIKEFKAAVEKLKEGQISGLIKTQFGYHIIKLNKIVPSTIQSFEEVKNSIVEQIKSDFVKKRREDYFKQIISENKMKMNEKEIENYRLKKLKEYQSKSLKK